MPQRDAGTAPLEYRLVRSNPAPESTTQSRLISAWPQRLPHASKAPPSVVCGLPLSALPALSGEPQTKALSGSGRKRTQTRRKRQIHRRTQMRRARSRAEAKPEVARSGVTK